MDVEVEREEEQEENIGDCVSLESVTTITEIPSQEGSTNITDEDDAVINSPLESTSSQDLEAHHNSSSHSEFTAFYDVLNSLKHKITWALNDNTANSNEYKQLQIHSLMELCDALKDVYTEESLHLSSQVYKLRVEIDRLRDVNKRCESRLTQYESEEKRNVKMLKDANDSLNQYICDAEDYHNKEVGGLKAKLSLIRLEKESQLQTPATPDKQPKQQKGRKNTKDLPTASSHSSNTSTPTCKKKRKSILFWKRNSKSLSNLNSKAAGGSSSDDDLAKIQGPSSQPFLHNSNNKSISIEQEMRRKYIEIENLQAKCKNWEQKESVLEAAITRKNIELNVRASRILELKSNMKSDQQTNLKCCDLLQNLDKIANTTIKRIGSISNIVSDSRRTIKQNKEKLRKLDWNVSGLNEENKLLLGKINTRNYELSCERTKSNALVSDMKQFIFSLFTSVVDLAHGTKSDENENNLAAKLEEKYEREGLKAIMEDLKSYISDIKLGFNYMTTESNYENQQHLIGNDANKENSSTLNKNKVLKENSDTNIIHCEAESAGKFSKNGDGDFRNKIDRDSGVAINNDLQLQDLMRLSDKIFNTDERKILRKKSSSERHFTEEEEEADEERKPPKGDMLWYMDQFKTKQLQSYKEDLIKVSQENYLLKKQMQDYLDRIEKTETELKYQKSIQRSRGPITSTPQALHSANKIMLRRMSNHRQQTSRGTRPAQSLPSRSATTTSIPAYNIRHFEFNCNTQPTYDPSPVHQLVTQERDDGYLDGNVDNDVHRRGNNVDDDEEYPYGKERHDFLSKSFERSTTLMENIFKSKQELEKQIQLSQQNIRNNKRTTAEKQLPMNIER